MWYHTQVDTTSGRLAQLVEHLLDVQEVTGSSPVPSTIQFVPEPDSLRKRVRVRFLFIGGSAPATERSCAARWRGLNPTSSCGDTARNGKQERATAGYHHGDGILPFVLYGAFGGNRCVRAYRGEPVYLWQGVITLDFVPKSVCQGAAPLWNLCGACTHIRSETTKSYSILSITTLVPLATTPIILFAKVM